MFEDCDMKSFADKSVVSVVSVVSSKPLTAATRPPSDFVGILVVIWWLEQFLSSTKTTAIRCMVSVQQ